MANVDRVKSAWITGHEFDSKDGLVRGAVYRKSGCLVQSSQRNVDRDETANLADPPAVTIGQRVVGHLDIDGADLALNRAIFAGHAFGGWGHSITEGLGSLWPDPLNFSDQPLIFVPWGRVWESAFERFSELVRLAGFVRNPLLLTAGLTVVKDLLIPNRLIRLDDIIHLGRVIPPEMNQVYQTISANALSEVMLNLLGPVYVSRGRGHRREEPFEQEVEDHFRQRGFLILKGWELGVSEQVARLAASSVIVGMSGSALHNAVFAPAGTPVIEILDSRELSFLERRNSLQRALCELRSQPYESVTPEGLLSRGGVTLLGQVVDELLIATGCLGQSRINPAG